MKNPWTIERRLGAFTLPRCGKYDHLLVRRNVHAEPALDDDSETLSSRCFAELALEPRALALERVPSCVELRQMAGLFDANRAPPNDRQRNDDECGENESHQGSAPQCYAALRHARSLALRERGLEAVSALLATTARFVMSAPRACPRQVH